MEKTYQPRLIFWELTKGCNLRCIHCRATATELSSPNDLSTAQVKGIMDQIADFAKPIMVLSGGEPLFRRDIFELAEYGNSRGLRMALATNGTLVTREVAQKIKDTGIKRVSISLDGASAQTHDEFRGIPGAFDAAVIGLQNLQAVGVSTQINMTIARHNADQLPQVLELSRRLGADALHTFLLVPVGCGVEIADSQMVPPEEYEAMLNWFYDRSKDAGIELKATCAPHYFRVAKQRAVKERQELQQIQRTQPQPVAPPDASAIGPTDMMMPGSTGIVFNKTGHPGGHPHGVSMHNGHHTSHHDMNAMTKGCLAGTGVCFVSNQGEVFPCGYLPELAGDLRKQSFADVWNNSEVFSLLRDTSKLTGKCGCCEFRNICMGCRARAYAATGDYMSEEPFCVYEPRTASVK